MHRNRTIYRRSVQELGSYVTLILRNVLFSRDLYTVIGPAIRCFVPVTCNRQSNVMRPSITVQYIIRSLEITIESRVIFGLRALTTGHRSVFSDIGDHKRGGQIDSHSYSRVASCVLVPTYRSKTFSPVMVMKPKRLYRPSFAIYSPRNRRVLFCIINVPLVYLFSILLLP